MAGLSPRNGFFPKPIRRLEPIERPAEEARKNVISNKNIYLTRMWPFLIVTV
jgi:hypothetical protein